MIVSTRNRQHLKLLFTKPGGDGSRNDGPEMGLKFDWVTSAFLVISTQSGVFCFWRAMLEITGRMDAMPAIAEASLVAMQPRILGV